MEGSSSSDSGGASSESMVDLNIKTLDSQIYSFHVDKNVSQLSSFFMVIYILALLSMTIYLWFMLDIEQFQMPVSLFKEKIASEIGLPVGQQRLIFRGKVLKDDHLLSAYRIPLYLWYCISSVILEDLGFFC